MPTDCRAGPIAPAAPNSSAAITQRIGGHRAKKTSATAIRPWPAVTPGAEIEKRKECPPDAGENPGECRREEPYKIHRHAHRLRRWCAVARHAHNQTPFGIGEGPGHEHRDRDINEQQRIDLQCRRDLLAARPLSERERAEPWCGGLDVGLAET